MKQSEIPVPPHHITSVVCGALMTRKVVSKTEKPNKKCDRMIYIQPAIDRRFMIGTCGKCGAGKIVRLKEGR